MSTSRTRVATGFDAVELERRTGAVAVRLTGQGARRLIETEPGGHRWQRVPPTEKRGRVHTSTVTVAVLDEPTTIDKALNRADVDVYRYKGSGAGGQHRNTTESAVRCVHRPTGLEARSESERSQHVNLDMAMAVLAARVLAYERDVVMGSRANVRRQQVGSGQRGDKVRTIREQDGVVTCERTGRRSRLVDYLRGDLDWCHPVVPRRGQAATTR